MSLYLTLARGHGSFTSWILQTVTRRFMGESLSYLLSFTITRSCPVFLSWQKRRTVIRKTHYATGCIIRTKPDNYNRVTHTSFTLSPNSVTVTHTTTTSTGITNPWSKNLHPDRNPCRSSPRHSTESTMRTQWTPSPTPMKRTVFTRVLPPGVSPSALHLSPLPTAGRGCLWKG